ncbi:MAG: Uma2 family endonuclease [Terriglobia bacterium]
MGARTLLTVLTVEDLERTPSPIEGGGYELDGGELIYVSPNRLEQWETIHRFYHFLKDFVDAQRLGLVVADTWFEILPHAVRAPDVAFIPADRLPGIDPKHALKVVPALAVEVLGSSEPAFARKVALESGARLAGTPRDMTRRIRQYFDAGVSRVIVIDPDEREVDIYSPDEPLRTLTVKDTVEVSGILPGFSLPVERLFE